MKNWEAQLMKHILNEKYLGEDEDQKMTSEEKQGFLQAVANYHSIGEMVYRQDSLREVAKTLGNIVEQAEKLTISESEHWFDNVTVSRHMKQLGEAYKVFSKTANEMSSMQQRLESAYEDMGSVLNRYYKIGEALKDNELTEDEYTAGVSDGEAGISLEEDQYTAGVSDYGPAFDDHMTTQQSKRNS